MKDIEIQLSPEDYPIVKDYAGYKSDRTRVCVFNSAGIQTIKARYGDILGKYIKELGTKAPEERIKNLRIAIENKKLVLKNPTFEALSWLDVRSIQKPEIKIVNFGNLVRLIESDVIELDDSFKEIMTPLKESDPISSLYVSNGKMQFRGELWSLNKAMGKEPISSLLFDEAVPIQTRWITLKDLSIISFNEEEKFVILADKSRNRKYTAKLFYITPIMKAMFKPNNRIDIVCKKIYGDGTSGYSLMDPQIIPRGLNLKIETKLKSPRTIPSALFNAARDEFLYRNSLYNSMSAKEIENDNRRRIEEEAKNSGDDICRVDGCNNQAAYFAKEGRSKLYCKHHIENGVKVTCSGKKGEDCPNNHEITILVKNYKGPDYPYTCEGCRTVRKRRIIKDEY